MSKILIISQYYPPEVGAAATRWSEFSQIMVDEGNDVTVLTEIPNYPTGIIPEGYPEFWFHEDKKTRSEPRVIRVPVWANPRKSTIQRLGFFATFMVSATMRALTLPKYDLIIVSSPPLFVGLIAFLLRPFKRAKYVLDLRDIWPESAHVLGEIRSDIMLRFGRWMERRVYDSVDAFTLAVPGFAKYLDREHDKHLIKPKIELMNGVSRSFLSLIDSNDARPEKGVFRVLFSGNIGLAQGLDVVLDAAQQLKEADIEFVIIGDGANRENLEKRGKALDLKNVKFYGSVPRPELVGCILESHVCLVPLIKSPLFLNAIPSKMLEYMAAGKPVIVGIEGEVEQLVESSQGGICIEPDNVDQLVGAIKDYQLNREKREGAGRSGAEYVRKNLSKESSIKRAMIQLDL